MSITRRSGPTGLDPHHSTGPKTFNPGVIDRAGRGRMDPTLGLLGGDNPAHFAVLPEVAAARLDTARNDALDLGAAIRELTGRQGEAIQAHQVANRNLGQIKRNRRADEQHVAEATATRDRRKAELTAIQQRVED